MRFFFHRFQKYCRLEEEGSPPLCGETTVQRREMAGNDVLGVGWTQVHGQGFLSTLESVKGRVEGHSFS